MGKLKLNADDLRVATFETEISEAEAALAAITGQLCYTRYTVYETCCVD